MVHVDKFNTYDPSLHERPKPKPKPELTKECYVCTKLIERKYFMCFEHSSMTPFGLLKNREWGLIKKLFREKVAGGYKPAKGINMKL